MCSWASLRMAAAHLLAMHCSGFCVAVDLQAWLLGVPQVFKAVWSWTPNHTHGDVPCRDMHVWNLICSGAPSDPDRAILMLRSLICAPVRSRLTMSACTKLAGVTDAQSQALATHSFAPADAHVPLICAQVDGNAAERELPHLHALCQDVGRNTKVSRSARVLLICCCCS